jgi:hypothetical protein
MPSNTRRSKLQTRPLIRESARTKTLQMSVDYFRGRERKIAWGSQMVAWYHDRLANWQSMVRKLWLGNVFTEVLPSNRRRIYRNTRPTFHLLLSVLAVTGRNLSSRCLATIGRVHRDLWEEIMKTVRLHDIQTFVTFALVIQKLQNGDFWDVTPCGFWRNDFSEEFSTSIMRVHESMN